MDAKFHQVSLANQIQNDKKSYPLTDSKWDLNESRHRPYILHKN